MKKAERYYREMRKEVKGNFEAYGHMNWTMTGFWGEDETKATMRKVTSIAKTRIDEIKRKVEFGIYGKEKAEYERTINNKIAELAEVRINL